MLKYEKRSRRSERWSSSRLPMNRAMMAMSDLQPEWSIAEAGIFIDIDVRKQLCTCHKSRIRIGRYDEDSIHVAPAQPFNEQNKANGITFVNLRKMHD